MAKGFKTVTLSGVAKECKTVLLEVLERSQSVLVYASSVKQLSKKLRKLAILLDDLAEHDDQLTTAAEGAGVEQVKALQLSVERYGRFITKCSCTGHIELLFECQQLSSEYTDVVVDVVKSLEAVDLKVLQCLPENVEDTHLLVHQLKRQPLLMPAENVRRLDELRHQVQLAPLRQAETAAPSGSGSLLPKPIPASKHSSPCKSI